MPILVQQNYLPPVAVDGATKTVGDYLASISRDLRYQIGTDGADGDLLLDYLNRTQMELLRWSRWQFLLSPVQGFYTVPGITDYWLGVQAAPPGSADTGLNISNMGPIKRGEVFDRTSYRNLYPTTEAPLLKQLAENLGAPRLYRNDVSTPNILNIYPAPDGVYKIEFRFFVAPIKLATTADVVQVPDKYQDVLIAGVDARGFEFLKKWDDANARRQEYGAGKVGMIRDRNLFPAGADFILPDPATQYVPWSSWPFNTQPVATAPATPPSGDGGLGVLTQYTLTPAPDGTITSFTSPIALTSEHIMTRNGQIVYPGISYNYAGTSVTFLSPPLAGDDLIVYVVVRS